MKQIQFLLFFFAPLFVLSQTKETLLPLTFHGGNGPFQYENFPVRLEDTTIAFKNTYPEVKGIPEKLRDIKRGIICLDFAQYIYQNFVAGKTSKENFDKIKNMMGASFNEKVLVKNKIKCYVNLISATDENNENVCIIDANNNYDFSDEIPFKPLNDSAADTVLNGQLTKISCQRVLNGKIINDSVPLLVVKSRSRLLFSIAQYATVALNIERKNYQLAICPLYFHTRSWKTTQMVLLTNNLKTKKAAPNLIIDDNGFIKIGNNIYKYNGVNIYTNSLSLQKASSKNQYSAQAGYQAPLFKSKNLLTGKEISLASYKGKYVLIDFWGTWCQPCRHQLPDLIKLNNSSDTSQFVTISIASSDELSNLTKFIQKENLLWPQIFSDKITEQYHISAFPTTLLVDPNGIIIAKDLAIDDLKEKLSKLGLMKPE